jgi:hypothetical protein
MFKSLFEIAEKEKASLVKSNFYYVFNNERIKKNLFFSDETEKLINLQENPKFLTMNACIWSAIYKRDFLLKNKIQCLNLRNHSFQDSSFNFKSLSMAKRAYLISRAFYYYRINDNQSVKSKKFPNSIIKEYNEIKKFLQIKKLERLACAYTASKFYAYKWNIERLSFVNSFFFSKKAKWDFILDKQSKFFDDSLLDEYSQKDLGLFLKNSCFYVIKTKLSKLKRKEI